MAFGAIPLRGTQVRTATPGGRHDFAVNGARALALLLLLLGGCKRGDDSKPPSEAMCIGHEELRSVEICDPTTEGCYVLTDEWRSQGGPDAYPPEATDCGGIRDPPNECCPGTKDCVEQGTRCLPVLNHFSGAEGTLTQVQNRCKRICLDSSACSDGEICWGGICESAGCWNDSDCDGDRCGRCVQRMIVRQSNLPLPGTVCVYDGRCGADSCSNCSQRTFATYAGGVTATFPAHECPVPIDTDAGL